MSITAIMELYYTGQLPTQIDELGHMQSTVENYASASLALAHAATDPEIQNLNLNTHISYKTISDHLAFLIRKQRDLVPDHETFV